MSLYEPMLIFLGGLLVIIAGAELVLRSAKRFAAMLGVRPIVIGLTIVSLGTTAPELAVGLTAGLAGDGTLAVGNVIGSNIFNLACILGLSALLRPLPLFSLGLRFDIQVLVIASISVLVMSADGNLSTFEGLLLLGGSTLYTLSVIRLSRRESGELRHEYATRFGRSTGSKSATLLALGIGIAITLLGARYLVLGATGLADQLGVEDALIGLTIVAIGTSAPELITTAIATLRNERDIAVGNLIGSSLYNLLFILAATTLASGDGISLAAGPLWFDLGFSLVVAAACLFFFYSGRNVSRLEGASLLLAYFFYLGMLVAWRI